MKIKLLVITLTLTLAVSACAAPSATPAPTVAVLPATELVTVNQPPAIDPATEAPPLSTGATFIIAPDQSEARFVIGEILGGAPNTVIGVTHDVEGSFTVNYAHRAGASFNAVRVDMSNFVTDNPFRNGAVRDRILESGNPDFRYAEFTVTSVNGLPQTVEIGKTYQVEVTGGLAMHGVSKEVTFTGAVTPTSATQVTGLLSVKLAYADFGIQILRLPQQVASVEDLVSLELEFVANAQ